MKKILLLPLLLLFITVDAQTTAIPDANFEQALINLGYDSGSPDGVVLTANINSVLSLFLFNMSISDLTGIEDFTALQSLMCADNLLSNLNVTQNINLNNLNCLNNQIGNLDVTQNVNLLTLNFANNQIVNIDVTQNILLDEFNCSGNLLTSLNVSQNPALINLWCADNQISNLNFSQNPALYLLECNNNQLSTLNLAVNSNLIVLGCTDNSLTCLNVKNGNNTNFASFFTTNNPSLTCIEVDNAAYSTANWTNIDAGVTFNTNCANPCSTFGVGMDELTFSSVSIYPNPTRDWITVSLEERTPTTISLRNSLGQLLLSVKHPSSNEVVLDISNYPNGLYFLQVEVDGQVITRKVVKE